MASEYLQELCTNAPSIATELAKNDSQEIDKVIKRLIKDWKDGASRKAQKANDKINDRERMAKALTCGKFTDRPSDLFLKIYADILQSMEAEPFANLVSPSVVGATGVIPLSIVSVIPDIMRHYADLIVHAKHEVFLATNYWEDSHSAALVSDGLRRLSKKAIDAKTPENERVVVKLIYDRGTPGQIINNHAPVPPEKWADVGLPKPEELQGIHFEVVNYHRPPLGTFHAKYLVVDRKVACLNSNNIQDRPNVEMMVHFEGPIVEAFYDVALYSWANAMKPPLPLLSKPPVYGADNTYKFGEDNEYLKYIDVEYASAAARELLHKHAEQDKSMAEQGDLQSGGLSQAMKMATGVQRGDEGEHGKDDLIGQHPAMKLPDDSETYLGPSTGASGDAQTSTDSKQDASTTSIQSPRSGLEQPGPESNQQTMNVGASGPEVLKSEANLSQSGHPEDANASQSTSSFASNSKASSGTRVDAITRHLNAATLTEKGTAVDDDSMDDFRPHILHRPHKPCPIAMANRAPRGTPGHEGSHDVPQNIAWLSALKYAQRSVFIQTPTFNASPVIPATLDAVRRGVEVTLYLDLGFNDLGEMIPFQGGTNEQVIHGMYEALHKEDKGDRSWEKLRVYWYTAKDQAEPISATKKSRNCHVKFMAVDDTVAIQGNGNQDTQSWFHSQEVNALIDSPALVAEWLQGINANQNTVKYGLVSDEDGVWRARDGSGRVVESSGAKKGGPFGGLKGIGGAIRRLRGTGGF